MTSIGRSEEVGALSRSDAEAIIASRTDPHVFATVFDRHYDTIAAYLHRRVGPALADELAAETFLRAFAARPQYDTSRLDARPWLYGIAANLLRRHWRAEERRLRAYARAVGNDAQDAGLDAVNARLDARNDAAALAMSLACLKPREREVLLLHAWADLSYEEIADALSIPVGTVRSRLHRARTAMRDLLETTGEGANTPSTAAVATSGEEIR
jgi:RNA polymerase sigma-70 factor (ECF subfamily)